jgi:hypothetical protein
MPSFTFTSPDGKSYTVNGPDGATQDQAWAILQQQLASSKAQSGPQAANASQGTQETTLGDYAKQGLQSAGRMLVKGATAIPGIAADAATAVGNIATGHVPLHNQDGSINWSGQADSGAMNLPTRQMDQNLEPVLGKSPPLFTPGGLAEVIGSGLVTPSFPGQAATRAANDVQGAATTRAQQLSTLESEGVRLDNAQALNTKAATTAKLVANDGAFGDAKAFQTAQAGDFTKAALKKMGINDAREATPTVMQGGKQALKDTYNAIAQRNGVVYDSSLDQVISRIRYAAGRSLTPENARVIHNQIDDLQEMIDTNGGRLSGDGYQQFQSSLGEVAKDGGKAPFVTQLRQALTEAMQRQAPAGDAALLARTNQRYAAMKAIEKSITPDNTVSPSLLYNSMDTAKWANQSVYGQGANQSLMELAQAGKSILGRDVANSGTPQRVAALTAATTAGAAVMGLATGHFETAAELTSAAIAAGFSQKAAHALAYTQGGRQWLQRWAQAQQAARSGVQATGQIAGRAAPGAIAVGSEQQQ